MGAQVTYTETIQTHDDSEANTVEGWEAELRTTNGNIIPITLPADFTPTGDSTTIEEYLKPLVEAHGYRLGDGLGGTGDTWLGDGAYEAGEAWALYEVFRDRAALLSALRSVAGDFAEDYDWNSILSECARLDDDGSWLLTVDDDEVWTIMQRHDVSDGEG